MKSRAFWMLGLAIILAAASVFFVKDWLDRQSQVAEAQKNNPDIVKIVVAKAPLSFGNIVRKEHLRLVEWPATSIPEGAFNSFDEILKEKKEGKEEKQPVERVALRSIEINEPILKTKISGFGGRASLSSVISEGMRATTIRVNDVNGVAGFVLPSDRVDVLLTRDPSAGKSRRGKGKNLQTDVLLQNLKVLAIDQDANEAKDKPAVVKAVTLEVTSEQAQKLVLAQQVGFLSLALRNVTNAAAEAVKTISINDLRVGEANNVDPKAKPKKRRVVRRTVKKNSLPSIRIVRGTTTHKYNVSPERPVYSTPVEPKPTSLVPGNEKPAEKPAKTSSVSGEDDSVSASQN